MMLSRILPLSMVAVGLAVAGCQSTTSANNASTSNQQVHTAANNTLNNQSGTLTTIKLTSGKTLTVNLPTNWTVQSAVKKGPATHIELTNNSVTHAPKVMMSLAFTKSTDNRLTTLPAIRQLVEENSQRFQSQAVENPIRIQKLANNNGYYFKITDKTMNPNQAHGADEYMYMFQGAILVKEGVAIFSGLTDDLKRDEQQILSIINSAQIK
ncbi:hypothetical protein [Psychrobacter sp. FDAARGOS_221]|uniref:hypothetical protein n=1 Tax=Psychrobacter sp. FDAARGOS_221 TaxID=1975705 RepID=UPI000BB5818C|nr:hypothetical protein [Psychrobacter sp. FDAARGOS_221]PNK59638.1 hypothetical protein A6J60_001245 [Psychrobacter sp. FDAARGOS_221]